MIADSGLAHRSSSQPTTQAAPLELTIGEASVVGRPGQIEPSHWAHPSCPRHRLASSPAPACSGPLPLPRSARSRNAQASFRFLMWSRRLHYSGCIGLHPPKFMRCHQATVQSSTVRSHEQLTPRDRQSPARRRLFRHYEESHNSFSPYNGQ